MTRRCRPSCRATTGPARTTARAGQAEKKGAMEIPKTTAAERIALKSPETLGPGAQVANRAESAEVQGNSSRLKISPGSSGGSGEDASDGRKGQVGVLNLMPSAAALDKIIGAAPNDHLDAEEGTGPSSTPASGNSPPSSIA